MNPQSAIGSVHRADRDPASQPANQSASRPARRLIWTITQPRNGGSWAARHDLKINAIQLATFDVGKVFLTDGAELRAVIWQIHIYVPTIGTDTDTDANTDTAIYAKNRTLPHLWKFGPTYTHTHIHTQARARKMQNKAKTQRQGLFLKAFTWCAHYE